MPGHISTSDGRVWQDCSKMVIALAMNRKAVWLFAAIALLAVTGWLFRYDVEPMSKSQFVRLDRITGMVRICDAIECVEPSVRVGLSDDKRTAMLDRLKESAEAVPEANPLIEDWNHEQDAARDIKP